MNTWNTSGVCVTPLKNLYGSVYCDGTDDEIDVMFPYGCGDINYIDEISCLNGGGIWRIVSTTSEECTQLYNTTTGVWDEGLGSFLRVTEDSGLSCGLVIKNYTEWSQAEWKPSDFRELLWTKRNYTQKRTILPRIDYISFTNDVLAVIGKVFTQAYKTDAFCRYEEINTDISSLLCDLLEHHPDCYSSETIISRHSASGLTCSGVASDVKSSICYISFYTDSYSKQGCYPIDIYSISKTQFELINPNIVSSALFVDSNTNTLAVVVNQNDAVVGQLISNGVELKFDIPIDYINLCVYLSSDIVPAVGFTEKKLAKLLSTGSITIIPTTTYIHENGGVCGNITEPGTYFAVQTVSNWEEVTLISNTFLAMNITAAVLYLLLAIGFLALLFRLFYRRQSDDRDGMKFKVFAAVTTFCFVIVRAVYLLSPPNTFTYNPIGLYFIFELPTFLFFSLYTVILYLWGKIILHAAHLNGQQFYDGLKKLAWL